ncbi:MAG: ABC transporter ATP-binding protein [Firmicutes bacterium]|nr:ABC transporter ATP-binding protein [Bacillota bacterium]
MSDIIINIKDLTHLYGKKIAALDNLNLSIPKGEIFGIIGPDGAGKTTLLRIISTVMTPTRGDVKVFGADTAKEGEKLKQRIGYLSQRFSLYGDLTVRENLDFYSELFNVPVDEKEERIVRQLRFTNLEPFSGRLAEYLSGGMKQKLALAATIIHTPDLVILDEPTTGVDALTRREFWKILYDINLRGITIVIATPYMDEADRCHRVGFLYNGKLKACDTPANLIDSMKMQMIELVCRPIRKAFEILKERLGERVILFGDTVHILAENAESLMVQVKEELKDIEVISIHIIKPTLEDLFVSLMEKEKASAR